MIQESKVKSSPADSHSVCVCVCKPGFAKLTVDYSEDQRSQRIALSAINNAFGVHSDHVQDIVVTKARSTGTDSLYSCILTATVQHSPQESGTSGPRSLGPGSSVPK